MCMEDIRLGRGTYGQFRSVAVSTTATQLWGNSQDRTRVILTGPRSGIISIAPNPSLIFGEGITMAAGDRPIEIAIERYGKILTQAWFAIISAGTATNDFFELFLTKQ